MIVVVVVFIVVVAVFVCLFVCFVLFFYFVFVFVLFFRRRRRRRRRRKRKRRIPGISRNPASVSVFHATERYTTYTPRQYDHRRDPVRRESSTSCSGLLTRVRHIWSLRLTDDTARANVSKDVRQIRLLPGYVMYETAVNGYHFTGNLHVHMLISPFHENVVCLHYIAGNGLHSVT